MNQEFNFPFERARRVTPEESHKFSEAICKPLGMKLRKRGKPAKNEDYKYKLISLKLHPKVLGWATKKPKKEALAIKQLLISYKRERISWWRSRL